MGERTSLILCQPDSSRGCSACCGLFNFRDISRSTLAGFLGSGRDRIPAIREDDDKAVFLPRETVRDIGSHVCPCQGFLDEARARPGCLLHPLHCGEDRRGISLFGSKICGDYLCPAHYIFTDVHARLLLEHVRDWYHYSIALIDPESFIWMVDTLLGKSATIGGGADTRTVERILFAALQIHADHLRRLNIPVFNYALSEYRARMGAFSLGTLDDSHREEKALIIEECARLSL